MTTEPEYIDPVKPAFRWSFSQWETYNGCPAKWNFGSRMKLPRSPAGAAAQRGLDLHDRVEHYIKKDVGVEELLAAGPAVREGIEFQRAQVARKYIPILDEFRNHPNGDVYTEKKLAFDSGWYLCPPVSKFASCVGVLDAARFTRRRNVDDGMLEIGEWKSGKPKDTHADQRKLYAMFGMKTWMADEVRVTTYYLEDTAPPERVVLKTMAGFHKLAALWDNRIHTMQRDSICAPRPSWTCRFCDYAKDKGGPCQFGG